MQMKDKSTTMVLITIALIMFSGCVESEVDPTEVRVSYGATTYELEEVNGTENLLRLKIVSTEPGANDGAIPIKIRRFMGPPGK